MPDTTPTARVFRARYGISYSAGGSGGDWRLYEDVATLKRDLLAAYLDVLSHPGKRDRSPRSWFARRWRQHLRGDDEAYPCVREIYAVEQIVDGEWVEITPEFIDPDVQLRGVR